jgi:hypothetical protein
MKKSYLLGAVCACLVAVSIDANATLINGSVLSFNSYGGGSSIPPDSNGSWFSVEPATFGVIGIASFDGLILGSIQTATGSHSGVPDGSESPTIDNPHDWFGNTGMLSTVSDTNVLLAAGNTATIDFTGIRWSWAGTDNIVIYDPTAGDSGAANISCVLDCGNGDTYILDYIGHIEQGSPSGLGGEEVRIHLEGTISAVPIPAAVWLFGSGLLGLVGIARKKAT